MVRTIVKLIKWLPPVGIIWFGIWAPGQTFVPGWDTQQFYYNPTPQIDQPFALTTVTIMTWNIAFAYGLGSEGGLYEPENFDHFQNNLVAIAEIITSNNADIVVLQEVDIDASRSHGTDQAAQLAKLSGYPYVTTAISWDANYVPFPYWPLTRQFGQLQSGGAILSRWPINEQHVWIHPKPEENPWWYNIFYPARYGQFAQIAHANGPIWVINQHLEAFSTNNRAQQVRMLTEIIQQEPKFQKNVFIAGDFNTVPADAKQKIGFEDHTQDDYRGDPTWSTLQLILNADPHPTDQSTFWTFPADSPNRRLDYVRATPGYQMVTETVIEIGPWSDHRPVVATFVPEDT